VSAKGGLITPLPAAVEQIFTRDTSAVLKTYNPPYVFVPVQEPASTHFHSYTFKAWCILTPSVKNSHSQRRYNQTMRISRDVVYDKGNAITRLCADVVGFGLTPEDHESCILTFKYLPFKLDDNDYRLDDADEDFEICAQRI
jgi:hypothetical protein